MEKVLSPKKKKRKKLKVSIKYLDRQSSVIFQNPTAEYGPRNRLTETDSSRSCPVRFLSLSRCIQNQKSHPPTVQNLTGSTLLLSAPNSQNPKKKKKSWLAAMDMQQGDLDRIFFFEHARKTAEATYAKDPLDADVRFFF